jgi:hypothetical protein
MSSDKATNSKDDVEMNGNLLKRNLIQSILADDESDGDESNADDEEMAEEDPTEGMEKLDFEFEALPPVPEDVEQIANLLTQVNLKDLIKTMSFQIFLRTDINFEGLATAITAQSPIGCVFKTTEECADDENEDAVYGISTVLPLSASEVIEITLFIQSVSEFWDWRFPDSTCQKVCRQ